MPTALAIFQGPTPQTAWDMVLGGSLSTRIVLLILLGFSFASWVIIIWKARQLREVRRQGDRFIAEMERANRLDEAYVTLLALPESPYGRVFRHGIDFFGELRPGALQGGGPAEGLSLTQLEALRLVMEKEEAEEVDEVSRGLPWLAIIASISPLLGLMGTVIGVMNAFLGITAVGSANIAAVAPGVADALITTVAGLSVAIPAVIGYNHFVSKVHLFTGELEGFSSEFIGTLAREGRV